MKRLPQKTSGQKKLVIVEVVPRGATRCQMEKFGYIRKLEYSRTDSAGEIQSKIHRLFNFFDHSFKLQYSYLRVSSKKLIQA